MKKVMIPPICCPIPYRIGPFGDELETGVHRFVDRFAIFSEEEHRARLHSIGSGKFSSEMFPYPRNVELAQIMADYTVWAFSFDDEYCDEGETSRDPFASITQIMQMQRAIESPEVNAYPQNRYAMALRDIRMRIDRYARPMHSARFVNAQRQYFLAEMAKLANQRPTLSDGAALRMYAGGGTVFPTLGHISTLVDIDQTELEDRRVCALFELVSLIICWGSDVFSYAKEVIREPSSRAHNVVACIERSENEGVEAALTRAVGICNKSAGLYMRLREDLAKTASEPLLAYIDSIDCYWRGGIGWIANNRRYRFANGIDGETLLEGGDLIEGDIINGTGLIDIPSVDWWWAYDPALRRDAAGEAA